MIRILIRIVFILMFCVNLSAQKDDRKHIPISIPDIVRAQAASTSEDSSNDLNERIRYMAGVARFSEDYLLGPGDVVEVSVFGIDRMESMERTLDSNGEVNLPYLDDVNLAGLTSRESEVRIATLYDLSVLKDPQVTVNIKEYRSQSFDVLGAVKNPGSYQLTRKVFLVNALGMAGGLMTEIAESKAVVHRAALVNAGQTVTESVTNDYEEIVIDLDRLLIQGDKGLNIPIYAGDVINVPERVERYFYVVGDVNRSGAFEMRKGEKITLTQAIASAGGPLRTAKTSKTSILRQLEDGTQQQIDVDIKKIWKGEAEDMVLASNDVVLVPGSTTKIIGKTILGSIGSVIYALVVAGVR